LEKSHQGDFLQAAIGSNSTCHVKPENCKSRATKLKEYHCTINGSPSGFIHLEISLLSGRSEAVKSKIGTEYT
jgi:5-carboxymethyl-2-hydroxymuconate isomerase